MLIWNAITHFFTSIFIAYIGFTGAIAERIEHFFADEPTQVEVANTDENAFERLAEITDRIEGSIQNTLLKNAEFQRAATYASKLDESQPDISGLDLDDALKGALVNIYCQYKTDDYIRTTTGTGFFVNQKGIILTNAHVAQFLLLEDTKDTVKDAECVIRAGNPATPKYKAELLYISPTWVFENADLISSESPRGTGERDYALLYVSKSMDNKPLPTKFPAIPVHTDLLARSVTNADVITAGYPAEILMRRGADAALKPVVASSKISTLYTFGSNYADIFSIGESDVGEQGSSGGPIMHKDMRSTIGLIVTKGDEKLEGTHSLRALTLSYIDRTIKEETGFSLMENMQGDPALRGAVFKKAMIPFLAEVLSEELR